MDSEKCPGTASAAKMSPDDFEGFDEKDVDHNQAFIAIRECGEEPIGPSMLANMKVHFCRWVPVILKRSVGAWWGQVPPSGAGLVGFDPSLSDHQRAKAMLTLKVPLLDPIAIEATKIMFLEYVRLLAAEPVTLLESGWLLEKHRARRRRAAKIEGAGK